MQGGGGPCFVGRLLITDPETEGRGVRVTRRQRLPGLWEPRLTVPPGAFPGREVVLTS